MKKKQVTTKHKSKRLNWILILLCLIVLNQAPSIFAAEYSDTSRFMQGFTKVIASPFYAPKEIIQKTFTQMPPIGTVNGAITGVFRTVTTLMSGLFDMAGAAAPYAKYALFF
ncbi:MAG: hypothetical protein HY582_03725 [Candidatus Omnitrophica bacterium]|nr:hypothetical protein [Candidatus Omnitrophota bacterium]